MPLVTLNGRTCRLQQLRGPSGESGSCFVQMMDQRPRKVKLLSQWLTARDGFLTFLFCSFLLLLLVRGRKWGFPLVF